MTAGIFGLVGALLGALVSYFTTMHSARTQLASSQAQLKLSRDQHKIEQDRWVRDDFAHTFDGTVRALAVLQVATRKETSEADFSAALAEAVAFMRMLSTRGGGTYADSILNLSSELAKLPVQMISEIEMYDFSIIDKCVDAVNECGRHELGIPDSILL
ncbi:hypothetical protein LO763_22755 [Glycomyces sp. A-F 0318]|uniref:hypothetical protein n=1 Tax=Glycomyces amatae TaxID=2881355 RepID=UPI001E4AED37|nr:hypothetical protein [Glycomyces amatae]MCD0446440.1 hypothetical protein [Glycomyces amatae]